jgi:hypothetical protein
MMSPWPAGALEFFLELGILKEIEPSDSVFLWECEEPEWIEPMWLPHKEKGRLIGFYSCGHDWCGHVHEVEAERRRRWATSFERIASAVVRAIDSADDVDVVPGRIRKIGSLHRDGVYRELFLVRGVAWPDADEILAQAQRLRSSPAPAILTLDKLPARQAWDGLKPAVLSLAEVAFIRAGKMSLDLSPLFLQTTVPHADASAPEWLTVTEAARLLIKDLPGLALEQARARVSVSASRGSFRTNGQLREKRRIDRDSFATWRLAQRDKDLDAEDADEE